MKKILALVLAIMMMATLSVTVFAAETETKELSSNATGATAEVTYNVGGSYVVLVPAAIPFGNGTTTSATVAANNVSIENNQKLKVTVYSATYRAAGEGVTASYVLTAVAGNTVDYTIKVGESTTAIGNNATVLEVAPGVTSATATLNFANAGTTIAGNYSDTLTFIASVITEG